MKLWFKSLLGGLLALSLAPALPAQVLRVDIMSPTNESALGFKPGTRQATATATLGGGVIPSITLVNAGSGYSSAPIVTITGNGSGAQATAVLGFGVASIAVSAGGTGYASPTITITGNGSGATASAIIGVGGTITSITVVTPGTGYTVAPTITITEAGGSGAAATATLATTNGSVASITLTSGGTGYQTTPTVTIAAPAAGTTATATAGAPSAIGINRVTLLDPGAGYTAAPTVTLSGGGGTGAVLTAVLAPGAEGMVSRLDVTSAGSGFVIAPTVTIAPPDGVVVISARISGTASIFTTIFFVDGKKVGEIQDHTASEVFTSWTPPQPGSYFITAQVKDKLSNEATSLPIRVFVEGTSIISPVTGSIVPKGSSVVVTAEATKSGGFVKQIEFFVNAASVGIDSTAPYSVPYTPAANGAYTLTATAKDNNDVNLTTSTPVTINVVTPIGTPPAVSIVNPIAGSSLSAGKEVTITADASDTDGFISKVEFYLNGNQLSTDQSFPYSTTWAPVVAGTYSLMAIAYDDKANAVASALSTVTVRAGLPTIEISSPAIGSAPVVQGSKVSVTVRAAGADGGITSLASITLLVDGSDSSTLPKNPDNLDPPPPLEEPFVFEWVSNVTVGTHALSARVIDNNGLAITSAEVPITVITNVAPTVAITSPLNGSTIPLGQAITVNATANDSDGSVAKVAFTVNGIAISEDTTAPYSASYTPLSAGNYQFQASVTDNLGKAVSSAISTVIVAAPTGRTPYVSLRINEPGRDYSDTPPTPPTAPVPVSYGSTLLLSASALDVDGTIARVEFYADGVLKNTSYAEPYCYSYYVNTVGVVELVAAAYDNDGNKVSSAPIQIEALAVTGTTAYKVELTSPISGSTFIAGQPITFTATNNLGSGGVPDVDFYVNNDAFVTISESPYTTSTALQIPGIYQIRAVVRRGTFTTISVPALVTITQNTAPSVVITAPAANTEYSVGQIINVSASAADLDGGVTKVEFFQNGASIGTATSAPYTASFKVTTSGICSLTAVATDSLGATTTSTIVPLSIKPIVGELPSVSLSMIDPKVDEGTTPTPSTDPIKVAYGSTVLLTARAVDPDGTIQSVTFYVDDQVIATVTSAPFRITAVAGTMGTVKLTAVAVDNDGNSVVSDPVTVNVVSGMSGAGFWVKLVNPIEGGSYVAGEAIAFTATTNIGSASKPKIDFYVGSTQFKTLTTAPYTTVLAISNAGTFDVRAVVRVDTFVTVSDPVRITVKENQKPSVSITSPANGSVSRLGTATKVTAQASDSDGTISEVEFYANGVSIGKDTEAPYEVTLNPTAEGLYRLTAIARDSGAQATVSSTVSTMVALQSSMGSDSVYKGQTSDGSWTIALLLKPDKSGLLIASSSSTPTNARYFTGLKVESGALVLKDGNGTTILNAQVNDTGFAGDFSPAGTPIPFIIPITIPTSLSFSTGLYSGNVMARLASEFHGVLAGDGVLVAYLGEGDYREAGSATVASDGTINLTLSGGSRISGRLDASTGFLAGTVTGQLSGNLRAALATGPEISDSSLRGISTRALVGTGDNVLIAGFIVAGDGGKPVFLRALGPTLALAGLNGLLSNPMLDFYVGGTKVDAACNDNWVNTPALLAAMSRVYLSAPTSTLESISALNMSGGAYTAIVKGVSNGTGIGMVEIYDGADQTAFPSPRLRALASRGYVATGDSVMIAGVIIGGSTPLKVIVRGLGPAIDPMVDAPVLQDPIITVDDIGRGGMVRENDNWDVGNDPYALVEASVRIGISALPSGSKDSAILLKLSPGLYSVTVRGRNNGTGVAMVEIYEVK